MKEKIQLKFKYKGQTNEVQGISFVKGDYSFKGSEIDRQFSYSKIDFRLRQNSREQEISVQLPKQDVQSQTSVLESVASALGGIFDIQPSGTDYDADQAEYLRQQKLKKKKKRKGLRM